MGQPKIQKETMSELLLHYATWKGDFVGALWPHWSTTVTPQNLRQSLQLIWNSRFKTLGPTALMKPECH